jgi:hydroxyethylthiazole kinase-like uncharacterized protein yjeF
MKNSVALLSNAQMRRADILAAEGGCSTIDLMGQAGNAVASEILGRWSRRRTLVLCGPGDNGGDGFVIAIALQTAGWPVRIALAGQIAALKGAALYYATAWGDTVEPLLATSIVGAELVVDAIFGTGLTRAPTAAIAETLHALAASALPIVAVDLPSGVVGDSGQNFDAVKAALTVTFFRKKPAHLLEPGRTLCGEVVVVDIGISSRVLNDIKPDTFQNDPRLWLSALPTISGNANKYTRGHALIAGGYPVTGASRLAGMAAARCGAGLTTIGVPPEALPIYAASLLSVMVSTVESAAEFDHLLEDPRFSGLLIGPGAGIGAKTKSIALAMLKSRRPTVLDADALTVFQDDPTVLFDAIAGDCVITPHEGEFSRLFNVTGDKLQRARNAAKSSQAVVVLKGRDTVIAAPDGQAIINANAPSSLATAGAGDVLSGMILGLMAQGMPGFMAAASAVWMHGAAATLFGPGLIAEDLPDLIPAVVLALTNQCRA